MAGSRDVGLTRYIDLMNTVSNCSVGLNSISAARNRHLSDPIDVKNFDGLWQHRCGTTHLSWNRNVMGRTSYYKIDRKITGERAPGVGCDDVTNGDYCGPDCVSISSDVLGICHGEGGF